MRRLACLGLLLQACAQGEVATDAGTCTFNPRIAEECNGEDDNCDGARDEGFPNVGLDCMAGEGGCASPGKTVCDPTGGPGAVVCLADPGEKMPELCGNATDDDCDGLIDEGFGDHGMPCAIGTGACHRTGKLACSGDGIALVCDAPMVAPGPELCGNGIDDDCDGPVDEGFEMLMSACDGADADQCLEGMWVCSGDGLELLCSDPNDVDLDLCNFLDEDCNAGTPNGSHEATYQDDCDGADADACLEGKIICSGGFLVCDDPNDADPDVCDSADNDCRPETGDGAHDTRYNQACDGGDSDTCNEGTYAASCVGGSIGCSDPNNDNLSNDASNCGVCGTVCSNAHGSTSCASSACDPNCDFGWQACGALSAGCNSQRTDSAVCSVSTNNCTATGNFMGCVRGDTGNDLLSRTGYSEVWLTARVTEPSNSDEDTTALITLTSPPGVNYNVCVRCNNCAGDGYTPRCGTQGGAGGVDTVEMSGEDELGDDTFEMSIHIYLISADDTSCGNWSLSVEGNVPRTLGYSCDG